MNLRKNILSALLLAVGFILHEVVPAAIGGMKFDLQLAMLFIIIAINLDFKNTIATGIVAGIITALTTTFPGGQIPNMIDKLITSVSVYFIYKLLTKIFNKQISLIIIGFVGTIISGSVFLYSALIIAGLPAPFPVLFFAIVLPTAITNAVITVLVYNLVTASQKAVGFNS